MLSPTVIISSNGILRSHARHLLAELVLLALAVAEVAHDAELEGAVLVRERQRQRRGGRLAAGAACCSGIAAGRAPGGALDRHAAAAMQTMSGESLDAVCDVVIGWR